MAFDERTAKAATANAIEIITKSTTLNIAKLNKKRKDKKKNESKYKKYKSWWNGELSNLHHDVCQTYIEYVQANDEKKKEKKKMKHIKAKKEFKKYKKYRLRLLANRKLRQLNELFRMSVNGFWKSMKKMQLLKQIINVPIAKIKDAYEKTFTAKTKTNNKRAYEELKKYVEEHKRKQSCPKRDIY